MYSEPEWGEPTSKSGFFEILKDGSILERINISEGTNFITFGRLPENMIKLDHESNSRNHAILQFGPRNSAFIYDLNSTHGTFLNKKRLPPKNYVKLTSGNDLLQFGASTRFFLLQLEETLTNNSCSELKNESFSKYVLSFLDSNGIPVKSLQLSETGNGFQYSLDFSKYLYFDPIEPFKITSSGHTKEEALENFYEDSFNFLTRMKFIETNEKEHDPETKDNYEFINEESKRFGSIQTPNDALTEEQISFRCSLLKTEINKIKVEIETKSLKKETLNMEIVEDFDVYVQNLKLAELESEILKLELNHEKLTKVFENYYIFIHAKLLGAKQISFNFGLDRVPKLL